MFVNQAFLDWGLEKDFLINISSHTANLWDGGNRPVSMTTLDTVGKGIVGMLAHLEETKNRAVYVHDTVISQLELIDIVKSIDGKEWETKQASTKEAREQAAKDLASGDQSKIMPALFGGLNSAIYAEGYGNDLTGRTDNELFGIKEMGREEVKEVVRKIVEGKNKA